MFSGKGDDGYTTLWGGGRVPKYAPQLEAVGSLDEAAAVIGLARASGCHAHTAARLKEVQQDLIQVRGDLARRQDPDRPASPLLGGERVRWLEGEIQKLEAQAPPLTGFVLPGDSLPGAFLHQARCVVRRAERVVARMVHEGWAGNPDALPYLNRLSSYLFVLALWEDARAVGRLLRQPIEA
ncbi:MAG: cob(I)yrinic acid a,c-diamide adenosyltransferase [Anaerolineae bacterium]